MKLKNKSYGINAGFLLLKQVIKRYTNITHSALELFTFNTVTGTCNKKQTSLTFQKQKQFMTSFMYNITEFWKVTYNG